MRPSALCCNVFNFPLTKFGNPLTFFKCCNGSPHCIQFLHQFLRIRLKLQRFLLGGFNYMLVLQPLPPLLPHGLVVLVSPPLDGCILLLPSTPQLWRLLQIPESPRVLPPFAVPKSRPQGLILQKLGPASAHVKLWFREENGM